MPYVRVTRDQRGYENTFLLHSPQPGQRAVVLYWYRSAPGVRVGRSAFDEDAIRTIEERHPEVEFDWAHLIEEASSVPPDIDRPSERGPERRRRKPQRREPEVLEPRPASDEAEAVTLEEPPVALEQPMQELAEELRGEGLPAITPSNLLLDQLVGREIARRLRQRYAELMEQIGESAPDDATRVAWQDRAVTLDPDRWATPQDILHGVENADRAFAAIRREIFTTE